VAVELSRIDRKARTYALTDVLTGVVPPGVTGVDVALLAPRSNPTAATVWFPATYASGSFTVLLAGPDASSVGALVVTGSADIWMRISNAPEVDAEKLERITVLGGGSITPLPAAYVTSVNGMTGAVTIAAGGGSVTDNGDGTATTTSSSVVDNGNGTATAA
jgi:hypothetical protein